MAASKWLVLGLGNRLAGADGFGPAVTECLRAMADLPRGVELIDAHTDLLGNLHHFEGREHIILVDAALDANGGSVAVFEEMTFSTWEARSAGVHGLSAVMAVKLFRRLHQPGETAPLPKPRITLVAHLVREADFLLPLDPDIIRAGAEAVRSLVTVA